MRRLRRSTALGVVTTVAMGLLSACGASGAGAPGAAAFSVGVLYPTAGPQGLQGTEEQRGALLAAEWVNNHGGVNGHRLRVVREDVSRPEDVPGAMAALAARGVQVVVGSHGSDYSAVAATEATRRHMLVWETGAVGLTDSGVVGGANFVRMAPMGANLGKAAVDFVRDGLGSQLPPHAGPLRWAVAFVDDHYGRAVAGGASAEVVATGQTLVGTVSYVANSADFSSLAERIAATHPDVLFVSAYLDDGVKLRRAVAQARVPLLANLGTSSSYCMPAFGAELGPDAVGLFASDKPDADAVRIDALSPEGRATLQWSNAQYRSRFHTAMSSHALSGFSNALALFAHVLPVAGGTDAASVAAAAQRVKLPVGSLANGGGLDIAPLDAADAGNNRNAAGVIWEWIGPGQRAVVWPPAFATQPVRYQPIDA